MWLLRLLVVVAVIAMGLCLAAYVFTGQKGWLVYAWRLFRAMLFFALLVFALLFVERLAIIPW